MADDYRPPLLHCNTHLSTILPNRFRKPVANYQRVTLDTPDHDFLDLDLAVVRSERVAILLHGLEGSSDSNYIRGLTGQLNRHNVDVIAMNHRGCSGRPNKTFGAYHSGKTDDLQLVIDYATEKWQHIYLIGFSLGGNIVLKYTGDMGSTMDPKIAKVAGISVPMELSSSCREIEKPHNRIYHNRFLRSLKIKALSKLKKFPESEIDPNDLRKCRWLSEFDDLYTGPAHGFEGAEDYYCKCSSRFVLEKIERPTMIINAHNDTFLSADCYPVQLAESHAYIFGLFPQKGGHVGFAQDWAMRQPFWTEKKITEFLFTD